MANLRSGNVLIRTGEDSVSFEISRNGSALASRVKAKDIPEIIAFLNAYLLSQSNRRMGFRINLQSISQRVQNRLRISIVRNHAGSQVTPIDLSLTGVLVESDAFLGAAGEKVAVSIRFDDSQVTLPATVARRNRNTGRTAFHFHEVVRNGTIDPPPELKKIFSQLENLWLDQSLQLVWFEPDQTNASESLDMSAMLQRENQGLARARNK